MRRTKWLLSVLFVFSLAVYAQDVKQRAYDNGYEAGYNEGYNDSQAGEFFDTSGSPVYQSATSGWTSGQLGRAEYRQNFQAGFQSGYQAGYQDAANGLARNVANRAPQSAEAFHNGYQAGYNEGRRNAGATYAAESSRTYQNGTLGFDARKSVSIETYRVDFRQGFRAGYSDGYYGRAYDERYNVPRLDNRGAPVSGDYGATPYGGANTGYGSGYDAAFDNGYREGYDGGRADAGGRYRANSTTVYRNGTIGYDPNRDGSHASYRTRFQEGYLAGYDDGYKGRLARTREYGPRGVGPYSAYPGGVLATGQIVVPAGSVIRLRLNDPLSTKTNQPGDRFTATVQDPVFLPGTNEVAIPQGAVVHGTVTSVERGGTLTGNAQMRLTYDTISMPQAGDYTLNAETSNVGKAGKVSGSEGEIQGGSGTGRTVGQTVAGTAIGAVIGGIAGGGSGAGIGAAVGTAAGLGSVLMTRGRDLNLDAGTPMEIRLDTPLDLRR